MALREPIPEGLPDLLKLFGITLNYLAPDNRFELLGTVVPVAIAGTIAPITATTVPQILDVPFTIGEQVAAAAGTVHADTGPLPAGSYAVHVMIGSEAGVPDVAWRLQRRDAANAVNIWSQVMRSYYQGQGTHNFSLAIQLQVNERLRLLNGVAFAAGVTSQASIWATRLGA